MDYHRTCQVCGKQSQPESRFCMSCGATIDEETPEPPVERRFAQLVAENIKLIFAISVALFVGGVLLYYRSKIYLGLKDPLIQAIILGLVTVSSVIGGWTLVRKTDQTLPGRTLTLVGSLLVP